VLTENEETQTYYAIVLPLDCRNFEALVLRCRPWLRKYLFDHCHDRVRGQANGPRKVRDRVIFYNVSNMTSALHRVPGYSTGRECARTCPHRDGVCCVPYMSDMVCRWLHGDALGVSRDKSIQLEGRTGDGRCKRCAAMRSPGGSNVTTGAPNVIPRSEASEPPSEWPITQIFAFGYIIVMLLYKFCSRESL
jgi:uncharacterized protein YlaI